MHFEIEDKVKLAKWLKEHKCKYTDPENGTAIGGRLTYYFTSTGLGCINGVECACGEKCDTTCEEW